MYQNKSFFLLTYPNFFFRSYRKHTYNFFWPKNKITTSTISKPCTDTGSAIYEGVETKQQQKSNASYSDISVPSPINADLESTYEFDEEGVRIKHASVDEEDSRDEEDEKKVKY